MKNLKIALILLAAVAMFCSCSKDEDETTATANGLSLSVTGDVRELNVATMADPTNVTIEVTASDETNGLEEITGKLIGICKAGVVPNENLDGFLPEDELDELIDITDVYFSDFEKKDKTYKATMVYPFSKSDVELYASLYKSLRFSVTVVNRKENKSLMKEWNITLTAEEPATTAEATGDFTWRRLGSTKEGIQEFGLNFFSRATANIRPIDETSKLYILSSSDYAIESLEALNEKLTETKDEYRGVSVDASADYDDVIATVYNGKTYLMHITSCEINTPAAGTEIIIHGTYKRFANPTPAETK